MTAASTVDKVDPSIPDTLRKLRAIADQAPLGALPLSERVKNRAITMGFARVVDVRHATWSQLVGDFGEEGAREIAQVLIASGLRGDAADTRLAQRSN